MSFGDRLGMLGAILALVALATTILWPDKRWIGWIALGCAVVLLVGWGWLEIGNELPRLRSQYPRISIVAVFIIGGCLAVALWKLVVPSSNQAPASTTEQSPITPENIEENLMTWYRNVGLTPRKVDFPNDYFALEVHLNSGQSVGISRRKDRGNYLIIAAAVVIPAPIKAKIRAMSHDKQQQLSDDVNLDVARIPGVEYENKFPEYIIFKTALPITSDLNQHQFMQATEPVIHAVMTTEASLDANSRRLGTPFSEHSLAPTNSGSEITPPLSVTPEKVVFDGILPGGRQMTFTFRMTNETNNILYSPGFKLRIYSTDLSGDDFEVHLTPSSRKPVGDLGASARHLADVQAVLTRDSENHPIFYFYMPRLAAHDFREVTITRSTKIGTATVTGEPGYSTVEPQPQSVKGLSVIQKLNFGERFIDLRPIFLVADPSKDAESGKAEGGTVKGSF